MGMADNAAEEEDKGWSIGSVGKSATDKPANNEGGRRDGVAAGEVELVSIERFDIGLEGLRLFEAILVFRISSSVSESDDMMLLRL
jgi:hypothetical protein